MLRIVLALLLTLTWLGAFAQTAPGERANELAELLRKLHTTARLVHTTAHPDDEDGGMLTLESRGKGADVLLLTLTRGEGGQNKMGSNLLDSLGALRTLELLASDKYYGVEQRFTRVADFGFSKTPEETFQKWHGHDAALEDMVRVIRVFRPDVLVSRFQGNQRDGHGHHQASGILTREAFRAAADANRFPEQIREGLLPWQAKKLYMDNVRPFGSTAPPAADVYTLAVDTGATDPLLGMSYAAYAMQGLKHQLSQGAGAWNVPSGPHVSYYKLIDSVLPMPKPGEHEQDFFDGIDTTLHGLASRLGNEESKAPGLKSTLTEIESDIDKATTSANRDNPAAAQSLLAALKLTDEMLAKLESAPLSPASKLDVLDNLRTKREQLERAANLALGVQLLATVDVAPASTPQDVFVAAPGQSFTVRVSRLVPDGAKEIHFTDTGLDLPPGWKATPLPSSTSVASAAESLFRVDVPNNAEPTRPYFRRGDPETDTVYTIDDPRYATLPFMPPQVRAHSTYTVSGLSNAVSTTVTAAYHDANEIHETPVAVAPALSISVDPATQVLPITNKAGTDIAVMVQKNVPGALHGDVHLKLPTGWQSEPSSATVNMDAGVHSTTIKFHVLPSALHEGRSTITALAKWNGKQYSDAYTVITRADLGTAFYYQPAIEHVSAVNVKVPRGLILGYIMGAGDDIPTVLRQLGLNVATISEAELATGDLRKYDTIVIGIRAYDTSDAVHKFNSRLLDFVSNGGTLLVQYNSGVADFNSGHFTPYPAELSRDRVTVEEAPVHILAPQAPEFHYPNQITSADFNGWVQERGLYFMNQWDSHYEPLLESHDPGENSAGDPEMKGGLLRAHYGKGLYIYTGYSFFRQLPAGVPGAIRLFVNLVSAGHDNLPVE